jgi:hypothetical protein
VLQFVIVLAILAIVVLVVGAPIRRARIAETALRPGVAADVEGESPETDRISGSEVAELEASRDAKYREIRDAELDHRTGKLSDADFEAVDRGLRAEAVRILHELDRARGGEGAGEEDGDAAIPVRRAGQGAEPPGNPRI